MPGRVRFSTALASPLSLLPLSGLLLVVATPRTQRIGISRLSDVAWAILEPRGRISLVRRGPGEAQPPAGPRFV